LYIIKTDARVKCTDTVPYTSAILRVVILSVCLSTRLLHACFVTNPKNLPAIFYTTF